MAISIEQINSIAQSRRRHSCPTMPCGLTYRVSVKGLR